MSESNLPAVQTRRDPVPASYSEAMTVGATLAQSGFFSDARDASQAAAKVIAGMELGIGPMAAMAGIYIVKGKVTLGSNLIAGQVKRSGRYDFKVTRLDAEGCVIDFYDRGEKIGTSSFTKADAQAAGLWGGQGPWKQHPRNMLYARAMSNGAKWFCPDVFAGPVYTPDELGAEVDGETGEVIDLPAPPSPAPEPAPVDPALELARSRYKALRDDFGEDALDAALDSVGVDGKALADDETFRKVGGAADYIASESAVAEDDEALAAAEAESGGVISEKDRRALLAHAAEHGMDKDAVKALAAELFSVDSTTKIPAVQVDALRDVISERGKQEAA